MSTEEALNDMNRFAEMALSDYGGSVRLQVPDGNNEEEEKVPPRDATHAPSPIPPPLRHPTAGPPSTIDSSIPMFAESISVPRPLFFGSVLPTHVTEYLERPDCPKSLKVATSVLSRCRLRTFQPCWGSELRSQRYELHRSKNMKRPDIVRRAKTAPPRLEPDTQQSDGDTESHESLDYVADSSSHPTEDGSNSIDFLLQMQELQQPLSDQEAFSQMVLGSQAFHSSAVFSGTFKRNAITIEDDDDSLIGDDEQKTQVGANENLSKAIAQLALTGDPTEDNLVEQQQVFLQNIPQEGSRPLTNYELTGGCVPLFSVDDPSLPSEADLGIHETKEAQQRTFEIKHAQEMIEKVAPNVFGSVSCPNPSMHPNDFHSWNSRHSVSNNSGSVSSDQTPRKSKKRKNARQRFGWWNKPWGVEDESDEEENSVTALQLPPTYHSASAMQVVTPLEPTPKQLRENNLPLSRMHAATPMLQALPYLSDRPPSFRYVQIDTKAVAFPPVTNNGEIEPFYCTMCIFNVETIASSGSKTMAPVPDLQRCGRVTESLHFDYVANPNIANRCAGALWPYGSEKRLRGTRCGVFPIPSNLNISHLYAILIVRKVLSDESDFDPYLKPGKNVGDIEKLRVNAEKASTRNGQFLTPFAFGVAPLLQVFGTDNPTSATSRAVQIPLFKYSGGERQIINHIMVMLFPRADHKASGVGGPAPVTNGGTSMLVMRNFGYLGLHSVVDNKSSQARSRLVDFTGDLQLRRRTDQDGPAQTKIDKSQSYHVELPDWHPACVPEVTHDGGRNIEDDSEEDSPSSGDGDGKLYAQEVAPWPLMFSPSSRPLLSSAPGSTRGKPTYEDSEPFYYTSFCNELLCHPRELRNCHRGMLSIKVELRKVEWLEALGSYIAHKPEDQIGNCIHNSRRGPFLVQNAFTSCCAPSRSRHQFLEEFKVKLPLDLNVSDVSARPVLCLFFTIYRVKIGGRGKWKSALFRSPSGGSGSGVDDSLFQSGRLEEVGCGFLPLTSQASLLVNGLHDVRMTYKARAPSADSNQEGKLPRSTLILVEKAVPDEISTLSTEEGQPNNNFEDDTSFSNDSFRSDRLNSKDADSTNTETDVHSQTESDSVSWMTKGKSSKDPVVLSVRIVAYSSIHSQNSYLNDLLRHEEDVRTLAYESNGEFLAGIRLGKDFITTNSRKVDREPEDCILSQTVEAVMGICNYQMCSVTRSAPHLPRIMNRLWRSLISGDGEPTLAWANPSTAIPLRVNSFAAILHLVGASSLYLSKNGVTRVDGTSKFDIVVLGRVLALLFDEQNLFGERAVEVFDGKHWDLLAAQEKEEQSPIAKKSPPKRGHVRTTLELGNHRTDEAQNDSSSYQLLAMPGQEKFPAETDKPPTDEIPDSSSTEASDEFEVVVDSNLLFQSHLLAAAQAYDNDFDGPDGVDDTAGDDNGLSKRRYHTVPASALSTILEQADESTTELGDFELESPGSQVKYQPSVDVLKDSPNQLSNTLPPSKPGKKMRRPRVYGGNVNLGGDTNTLRTPLSDGTSISDDDIETMGEAYVDQIADSLRRSHTEEKRVGASHHRRRTNGSSIDWSLRGDERSLPSALSLTPEVVSSQSMSEQNDERISTLGREESSVVSLPSFADRLVTLGNSPDDNARWFPFAYEVVIMQWANVLKSGERSKHMDGIAGSPGEILSKAASRAVGVAATSAPLLFEIIKQSLAFRVKSLFQGELQKKAIRETPPLAQLDDTLLSSLEQIISMVTDACVDSRNFDSRDSRQMSIDLNDSIVSFLRDLYSFLSPISVHKLIRVYMSRFDAVGREHVTDRDSLIGLRCSWEITKLKLSAVTAFVRFADFVKVNGPQMLNWGDWWTKSGGSISFFDDTLTRYISFGSSVHSHDSRVRPHWLAEMLVEICMHGIGHAEQYIQHRSSSLLCELFWSCSQESVFFGISAPVASMFLSFFEKLLANLRFIAEFSPKGQLRKDVLSCGIFVLQSTPIDLLRAMYRRLLNRLPGKCTDRAYGMTSVVSSRVDNKSSDGNAIFREEPTILDVFSLLNLSLSTMEYEGRDENVVEGDSTVFDVWRKEFLPSKPLHSQGDEGLQDSATSRRWHAHDSAVVVVNACHQTVREACLLLDRSKSGKALLNPAVRRSKGAEEMEDLEASRLDIIVFVRGAASVYLHALTLRESDIVFAKTFQCTANLIKLFGIKMFLEAVGETLQHWMRVITLHCGARRTQVRIDATDLLELILRSTWECFGSFFRIRVPLLAVQTEVMERIVETAQKRYNNEQVRNGALFESFTNLAAEASLVPLWRTLDRMQTNPASQNVAFRAALIRVAGKLKKLYRGYVAARALSFIRSTRDKPPFHIADSRDLESDPRVRSVRLNILRVVNASEGFSKQFLGFQGPAQQRNNVAHYEAVEDALIDAADVFSPTELPEHRVAWLRMLAEFHNSRKKPAEEATCHYFIHVTLHLATRLYGSLWSNTPFFPWTDKAGDSILFVDNETTPTTDAPDYNSELNEYDFGGSIEGPSSFRRIFYRLASSFGNLESTLQNGASNSLFYGITFAKEYYKVGPWISLREMESNMVQEVERAGQLFLDAGIVVSSRHSWTLVTQYYAQKFNYSKLADAYRSLSRALVSQVPLIDTSLPHEVSATLGRFYRVWLHGGAPDELNGVEFVYRAHASSRLKDFGEEIREVIKSIMPNQNTLIRIVLDGLSEERDEEMSNSGHASFRMGSGQADPVKIKVTPLRPLYEYDHTRIQGLPEWFVHYVEEAYSTPFSLDGSQARRAPTRNSSGASERENQNPRHQHSRSFSATVFSSAGSTSVAPSNRKMSLVTGSSLESSPTRVASPRESDLWGVDKFCFVQPKDRSKPTEWWKTNNFSEKSLRVTQLQVSESFPACVARQRVTNRRVYLQSPLEAGIDAVCQWCAVLFRTAIATNGMDVLKTNSDHGIGTEASKVVADCIHNSHVKEIGVSLLQVRTAPTGSDDGYSDDVNHLSEDEIHVLQLRLARLLITFVQLLHLLVARNRELLLTVIKKRRADAATSATSSNRGFVRAASTGQRDRRQAGGGSVDLNGSRHQRQRSEGFGSDGTRYRGGQHSQMGSEDNQSYHSMLTTSEARADSAIAVQSELQRAFIKLSKALHRNIHDVMLDETPEWFKQCCADNYFSLNKYRDNKMPIEEQVCFNDYGLVMRPEIPAPSIYSEAGYESPRSRGGSIGSHCGSSVMSRTSDRHQMF